jgi:quercetin dioxygenase-like cupin family protein
MRNRASRLFVGVTAAFAAISAMAAVAVTDASKSLVVVRKNTTPESGAPQRFTGKAVVESRFEGARPSHLAAAIVSFEPGARTAWHTHPHGQMLVVTAGCGWVQQEGGERQPIRVGDIVWTPPGIKHWHGAGTQEPMSHAAVHERFDRQEVVWMQKVSDEEYGNASCKV